MKLTTPMKTALWTVGLIIAVGFILQKAGVTKPQVPVTTEA